MHETQLLPFVERIVEILVMVVFCGDSTMQCQSMLCLYFQLHFTISQLAVSGIKVNRLDMYGEVLLVAGYVLNHSRSIPKLR